jgi:hypothetical protein
MFLASGLDERGERDRHIRGAGCGGRRRCGVTRFMGDVCLRAGRICASTATGQETADLGMDKPLDSVTDDQLETRSAYSLEAPFPSPWDFNSVIGSFAKAKCKQPKKHRRRNAGHLLGASESPGALSMRKTAFASGPRVHRAPGVPHALSQEGGKECAKLGRASAARMRKCVFISPKQIPPPPFDLGKHHCLSLRGTDLTTPPRQAHGQTRIT